PALCPGMRPGAGFPPRARQAAQPPEIDQVHRCTPDPGRYAERGDAPVYAPPRPQDWADAGPSMATNTGIAIAVPKTLLILTPPAHQAHLAILNRLLTSRCDGHHKKCDVMAAMAPHAARPSDHYWN